MHAAIAYKQQEMLRNDLLGQSRFEDIIRWIEMHPDFMWRNISSKESMPLGFGIKITYLSLTYDAHASNTHGAPRGGVTNWERAATDKSGKPLPTGYPAWTGRIEFTITGEKSPTHYWSSDVMKKLGIHTGSGGGISGNRYGFGVTFWADDWPTLKMMRALKDDESLGHVRIGKADYFK